VRRLPVGSAPVRFQSGNSRDSAVKAGHRQHPLARQKRPICRDILRCPESRVLLAMQKVVGSNPISRSQKACICRPFLRAQSACASASGRTDSGLAAGRSSAVPGKRPVCRPILVRPNRSPSACLQKVEFRLLRPLAGGSCKRHVVDHARLPARCQRSRSSGASPISVRIR
jgi:hypothetical protein